MIHSEVDINHSIEAIKPRFMQTFLAWSELHAGVEENKRSFVETFLAWSKLDRPIEETFRGLG